MEKEIMIKEDVSENDLIKGAESIKSFVKDTTEKINMLESKMLLIIAYLEIKIKEEEKKEDPNKDILKFYKELLNEVDELYSSKKYSSYHSPEEAKHNISFSLKVSTTKLASYGITFSDEIDSVLTCIVAEVASIKAKEL